MDPSTYQPVEPIDELKSYIRRILVADSPIAIDQTVKPAPTGYNYIGWVFAGTAGSVVNGTTEYTSSPEKIHFSGQIQYQDISVRYRGRLGHIIAECTATGFYELTGFPGDKILGLSNHLADIAPDSAAPIDRTLATISDDPQSGDRITHRLDIFQQQLCALASNAAPVPDYVKELVNEIEKVDGGLKVADAIVNLSVSPRQVRRKFKEIVGIPPKYFAKVLQLNKAMFALYTRDQATLSVLAQDAGFYDQAHFIHVMQQFFAANPKIFLDSGEPLLSVFLGQSRNVV
ncbi:MAG: helix-turn-helix domain-containing protein [Cyanobacteria bacterium P01_E01_bin.45]